MSLTRRHDKYHSIVSDSVLSPTALIAQKMVEYDAFINCLVPAGTSSYKTDSPSLTPTPRFAQRPFNFLEELNTVQSEPLSETELMTEISSFFNGSIRPQSKYSLFNIIPEPDTDTVAAANLANAYNINSLMETFGGESLLVEQKVARTLGKWVGWDQAMGIACNGGKITLMYAIRSALSRLLPDSQCQGLTGETVVFSSEGGHYCVEHIASQLGLGSDNCWRVPSNEAGQMCPKALLLLLERAHAQGKKIAAIIWAGGTTINFNCEDTRVIHEIVEGFVSREALSYRPYLHLDSVIGWVYFTLLQGGLKRLPETLLPGNAVAQRLEAICERFSGLAHFDSFGVDFHKTGLCPCNNSYFVSQDRRFMDELGDGKYRFSERDFEPGQLRAYRYTFENSRGASGILSSWVALKKFGKQGLGAYVFKLQQGREALVAAIERQALFTQLNEKTLGHEVVFSIPFASDLSGGGVTNDELAKAFMQHCWQLTNTGVQFPLFSIVPNYRINNNPAAVTTAFLLTPCHTDLTNEDWDWVLRQIAEQKVIFETRYRQRQISQVSEHFERPIK